MNHDFTEQVRIICQDFEASQGISVSPSAVKLISQILVAIVDDPHPTWRLELDHPLIVIAESYRSAIPFYLQRIVASEGVKNRITTFDFLHWFAGSFRSKMCVFKKR